MGHIVSESGVSIDLEKIHVIEKWLRLKNTTEIRSFLGLVGTYRKFTKDFACMA